MPLLPQSDVPAGAATIAATKQASLARRILLDALFLGGLADALVHDGFGIGLPLWMIGFAATLVHLLRAHGIQMRREHRAWLAAAVFFAAAFAWRDSTGLWVYDFMAMLGALGMLGATLAPASAMHGILGQRIRDLAQALGTTIRHGIIGIVPLVFRDAAIGTFVQRWTGRRGHAMLRAALMTVPLLIVFGLLFGAADPLFGKLFALPALDWDELISHIVVAGFVTWVVGGWLRGALVDGRPTTRLPEGMPFALGRLEVTTILGGLVALFGLFIAVQVGWLFGGARLVRSTTGLSYAQYARHGFFELVWVSVLVLPLVVVTRAAIPEHDGAAIGRHRNLTIALLGLLGGVMASALGRMALYVHYYGLSTDRLFASVFMGWLALVFAWFAVTVLRGRARDFAAGMTITGFATLAALNVVNPDALVARVNVRRAAQALYVTDSVTTATPTLPPAPIDYEYLAGSLDGDATGIVVNSLLAQPMAASGTRTREAEVRERCDAVRTLLQRWGISSDARRLAAERDWRLWNAGARQARNAVRDNADALRRVTCWDSGTEAQFGYRDRRPPKPGEQWYVAPPAPLSPSSGTQ
jgi:hypothetical protein